MFNASKNYYPAHRPLFSCTIGPSISTIGQLLHRDSSPGTGSFRATYSAGNARDVESPGSTR